MNLWQANLGRGVSAAEFTRNLQTTLDAAGPRAVLCFQEIDEADAPNEWDILWSLTRTTHRVIGERTDTPILVPRHIEVVGALVTPACKGLAKYTPARSVVEAEVRLTRDLAVGVLNVHLPIKRKATTTRRIAAGRVLRAQARAYDNGVWAGDVNDRNYRTVVRGEKTVTDAGIDKAKAWAGAGRRLVVTDRRTVPLTIDGHDAHGARLWWAA